MQKNVEIKETWFNFRKERTSELRNKLVLKYLPFVKTIIKSINLPPNSILSNNDLVNIGIIGLVEAIEKYDPEQNIKFETFAYPRIKGAIFDELRRIDWLSRNTRRKAKEFSDKLDRYFVQKGEYDLKELSKVLNLDEKEMKEYLLAYQTFQESFFIGENLEFVEDNEEIPFIQNLAIEEEKNPLENIVENEKVQIIYRFLLSLPDRERLIATLYYYENLKFKEIGQILGLSESRVSQIHSSIIKRIRNKFKEMEE